MRTPASFPTSILQRINATKQFDGTLPAGAQSTTRSGSMYEFAASDAGGLFFWDNQEPMIIDQVLVDLGGAGGCEVYLVNLDANNAVIATEKWRLYAVTGERYLALNHANLELIVGPKQALQIVSSGSLLAKTAIVAGSTERTYMR